MFRNTTTVITRVYSCSVVDSREGLEPRLMYLRMQVSSPRTFTNTEVSNIKLSLSGGGGLACNIWHMTEVAAFTVKSYCC